MILFELHKKSSWVIKLIAKWKWYIKWTISENIYSPQKYLRHLNFEHWLLISNINILYISMHSIDEAILNTQSIQVCVVTLLGDSQVDRAYYKWWACFNTTNTHVLRTICCTSHMQVNHSGEGVRKRKSLYWLIITKAW